MRKSQMQPDQSKSHCDNLWSSQIADAEELSTKKGVAELRSSVIRINSKNASPARPREEGARRKIERPRRGGGTGGYIQPRMARYTDI